MKHIYDRVIEYQTTDINDTSFTFPYGLFPDLTFRVTTEAKEGQNGAGIYEFETEVRTGESIDQYRAISRSMFPPYRVYTDKQIFDPVENTVSSYEIPAPSYLLQVSPDNNVLASGTHWQDLKQPGIWHELKGLPENFNILAMKRISLSGNQLGIFESDESFLVYDFRNDSVAVPWESGGLRWREFSPNGEYYLGLNSQVINICAPQENDWGITSTLNNYEIDYYKGYYPYLFLPEQEQNIFVFLAGGKLVLWSCDRKELIAEAPCSAKAILDMDPQTSTLLCTEGSEKLSVYTLPDLTLVKEISILKDLNAEQNYSKTNLAFSCGMLYIHYNIFNAYEFPLLNIR